MAAPIRWIWPVKRHVSGGSLTTSMVHSYSVRVSEVAVHNVRARLDGRAPSIALTISVHNRIVVEFPTVHRSAAALDCASGSGLVLPGPWMDGSHPIPFVLAGVHQASSLSDPVLVVLGHASPEEDVALAAARAESVRCIMEDDAAAWVALATSTGSIRDVKGYLQYLNATLAWGCHVDIVDASVGPSTAETIEAFQDEYNEVFEQSILVDGICGEQTLEAIFRVLRFEWGKWLSKHDVGEAKVAALEKRFPGTSGVDTTAPALARIEGKPCVEVWLVEREDLAGAEPTAKLLLESKTIRYQLFDAPAEPWAWERGRYTIVTDLVAGEVVPRERYHLRSTDGEYDQTQTLPDDAVDAGLLELHFFALPCDKSYDLSVTVDDRETYELFTDVPYNKLHRLAVEGPEDLEHG